LRAEAPAANSDVPMMACTQLIPSEDSGEPSENPIQVVSTTIKVKRALTKSLATFTHPRRFREWTEVSSGAATFTKIDLGDHRRFR
jgi:hypothetical protein